MKFKDYVANLNKLLDARPETAEMSVVTSIDDEGNGFNTVHYHPTVGSLEDGGDFTSERSDDFTPEQPLNAVCVN